jgi:hypothetical protein
MLAAVLGLALPARDLLAVQVAALDMAEAAEPVVLEMQVMT